MKSIGGIYFAGDTIYLFSIVRFIGGTVYFDKNYGIQANVPVKYV